MKVLATTALAHIQDLGRLGNRSMGVGKNGVMDIWALQAGNALLKNELDTAAIEITMGSLTLEFTADVTFCLTGALYEAYLEDKRIASYWRLQAKAGQVLKLVRPLQGMYCYLCVHGGFANSVNSDIKTRTNIDTNTNVINPATDGNIKSILGSYSTNLKAGFGGFKGRYLQAGDVIDIKKQAHLPIIGVAGIEFTNDIKIIKSSEYEVFTLASQRQLTKQAWQLASSSNRMGYRLTANTPLELDIPLEMNSHGVDMGMIQVPPQGMPIVLMADTQTTGGYPKIASVIQADIGHMAQIRFGQSCHFTLVAPKQAFVAKQQKQRYINQIRRYANAN